MVNRSLENLLWENFGALEKTLQSHGYRTRTPPLGNGFVIYEVGKPDSTLPLNGTYLAIRKSAGSDSLESAILFDAPNLPDASSVIMNIPLANRPVKVPLPHRLEEGLNAIRAGLAGAGIAMIIARDLSSATVVGGFFAGLVPYFIWPNPISNAMKAFYSYLVPANSWHSNQKGVYAPNIGLKDATEGKEAIVALLQLTEIYGVKA